MAPIPKGGLVVSPDGRTATLEIENVAVVDQPKWPALDAVGRPAVMSFKMIWKATDEKILYDDPQKQFRVEGYRATAQLEARSPDASFCGKGLVHRWHFALESELIAFKNL